MNLIIVPFHDWRKILLEGYRTRDAHFIEEFNKRNKEVIIIINRPTTLVEIILKRKNNLIKGRVVWSKSNFKLYEIETNLYLIDFVSNNAFGHIVGGFKWFIKQYGNKKYITFINESLQYLKIDENYNLLNQNIFAYKLTQSLKPKVSVFDAWDDFLKFNVYKKLKNKIEQGYRSYASNCTFWITNSKDNVKNFTERYNPNSLYLISNGVDISRFVEDKTDLIPEDLVNIPRPIIGFGGKITQLLDTSLINKIVKMTPEVSFVFVGQLLDKTVYNKIDKQPNFYYLGDKHYDNYPSYVSFFDVCIVPYVTKEELKSGANSIKVYEYLAAGKKVVGTLGNGLEDLGKYLYLVNDANEFSEQLKQLENNKPKIDLNFHSWENKVNGLNELIEDEVNN